MKNEELKKNIVDEKTGIEYHLVGDYYLPNFAIENNEKITLNKYGRMRLNYLKNHRRGLYAELIMTGKLNEHLAEIDKMAEERVNEIIKSMAKNDNIPIHYDGKMNQLEWVGLMNNYKHCAEEIILNEIIWQ